MKPLVYLRLLCIGLISAVAASTAPDEPRPADSPSPADWLSFYAELVEETELRRRVNVLYPNPQSLFDGLQVGYVGVRHGNLTFRRRDMVSGSSALARITRVYDSRAGYGRDFGPGWRLSLAETLGPVDGGLVHMDGSGARQVFMPVSANERIGRSEPLGFGPPSMGTGGSMARERPHPTAGTYAAYPPAPQREGATLEVAGSLAVLQNSGTTRVFERQGSGSTYVLRSITSSDETLSLSYRNGLIKTVSDSAGAVFHIGRDGAGRIASVHDRWGRSVHYGYGAGGRLTTAQDMAGNVWTYEYGPRGRLAHAIGPNSKDILRVAYNGAGRVIRSHSGREYAYSYRADETVVTEGTGHRHIFGHNAAGATARFDSTNGVWWRLLLDESNRVTEVQSAEGVYRYAYGMQGELISTVASTARGTQSRAFEYDGAGRIVGVYPQDGATATVDYSGGVTTVLDPHATLAFEASPQGRIVHAEQDGAGVYADYDAEGNLTAFRSGADSVQFNRDFMGRIAAIEYAGGAANEYQYDALGNRSRIDFSTGGSVRYTHDPAGNIKEVVVTERSGEEKRQQVRIGDMNRVENITYEGLGALDIVYDAMGRAVHFDTGGDTVAVEYAGPDRIGRIVSRATGAVWSPNGDTRGEPNAQEVMDARLAVLHNDSPGMSHPDYGMIAFDGTSFALAVRDPLEWGVPGLADARRMLAVAEPLLSGDPHTAMMAFEKPSNPVFQPLEYRSTNCCVCIAVHDQIMSGTAAVGEGNIVCICLPDPDPPPPSVSIVTPPREWYIDNRLNMPNIGFAARLANVDSETRPTFLWTLEMAFDQRAARTYTHRRRGATTVPRWSPALGTLLAGANRMSVSVTVLAGDLQLTATRSGYRIRGENPTQAQIFAIANTLEERAVCWAESSHRQFNAARHTGIGWPLHGPPDGWGLMQLELSNPIKNWGEDELWNWRENLREGVGYLEEIYAGAEQYLNHWYDTAANDNNENNDWPSNPADDPENIWDDTFSRYNTGHGLYSENGNGGKRNCTRNAVGCAYARSVRSHMKNKPWE